MDAEKPPAYQTFIAMGIGFFCLAALALMIDLLIAQYCRDGDMLPGDIKAIVRLSEIFAHGAGVAMILLCIGVTLHDRRRKILRLACCVLVPGLAVSCAKIIVGRSRPNSLAELPDRVADTFHGLLPVLQTPDADLMLDRQFQSFPSGHSATAVGLAIGLSWLFPRGKWCFALFAALAMLQRIDSGAHFVSDTLVSAGLASFIAGRYVSTTWESRLLSRFERTGKAHAGETSQKQLASENQPTGETTGMKASSRLNSS